MNPGRVSPPSASVSAVFAKSLATIKRTFEDHAMLHFHVSISGPFRNSLMSPLAYSVQHAQKHGMGVRICVSRDGVLCDFIYIQMGNTMPNINQEELWI